ncbi:hypothetical protein G6R40_02510 [Chryseobacterium sp. POL2]|uniref:DUF5675 family protein n=1 Tax=Chryseobacterium sp. POL2 TaxID=2713414 RepID=UPI0013E1E81E|nr:DUF5675 family protein [Chryseobacterium sp. POL2]QIG88517.1 hypothetical protein G6R40_02060 [Chryseobacterium sp. POL2]QIG88604.1 hypothetical protein G6R40_02510 [Chryseobacterium sp. POL2]
MRIKIIRVAEGKQSTLSHLYIDGIFQCFLLEDKIRLVKIMKQTAIPTGEFYLTLNTWGGMNKTYANTYPVMHRGMIEIDGLPTFDAVYIHVGNTITQTAGCPLTGLSWIKKDGDFQVLQSREAYKIIYPKLLKVVQGTDKGILVENNFQF